MERVDVEAARFEERLMADTEAIQAADLCQSLTADIEPIEREHRLAEWDAQCTGSDEAFAKAEALHAQIMTRLSDRSDFDMAERLLATPTVLGQTALREVFRWRNRLASHQYDAATIEKLAAEESALAQQYNSFRAEVGGASVTDNEIDRILCESNDSAHVEEAWRASKQISQYQGPDGLQPPVAERLRDLVHLRNHAAAQIGYPNGYRASLELGELDQDWLFETLELLERATRPLFEEWKQSLDQKLAARFQTTPENLRPWHYGDRFFQAPPDVDEGEEIDQLFRNLDVVALTVRTFDELGFDIRAIVAHSDLFPGDPGTSKKCQHAFCTTIVAPTDVRVLCNVVPGKRWTSTMLHEFGHAVYGASLDASLPYALRDDPHTLANEAIALLMERSMLDAGWLNRIAGVPAEQAERIARAGRRRLAIKHLVFTRWVLVMCYFERALYENPDRPDLGSLWWDTVERFQGVRRPSPEHADHDWAAKIHFTGYPAYYQNYLLGELFGAQLEHAIVAKHGSFVGNRLAGQFLVERMFRHGARYPWKELIERISGEPFHPQYFLATLESFRD